LIGALIELQSQRVFAIRCQQAIDRPCEAYIAYQHGYSSHLPPAQRLAFFKQAAKIRTDYEKQAKKLRRQLEKARGHAAAGNQGSDAPGSGGGGQLFTDDQTGCALSACLPILDASLRAREPFDAMRAEAEGHMERLAATLPVYPRWASVPGLAALGLAVLLAEAGNGLDAYPHWYHLWKRFGLAPYRGGAMSSWRRQSKGLSKDEWIACGYSPQRRGRMAGDIGASLFFHKARNGYGVVYAARRERTALTHPEWSKQHSDNDARRIMLKALVKDAWRWWREAEGATFGMQTTSALPPPPLREAA
jgi:hypothetical protein